MILWCPICGNRLEAVRSVPTRWRCKERHEWTVAGPPQLIPYVPSAPAPVKG